MVFHFEWDEANISHIARHRVEPYEAEEILLGDIFELDHEIIDYEERFSAVGETRRGRILIVWATWRDTALRVITAWDAPRNTKRIYLQAKGKGNAI